MKVSNHIASEAGGSRHGAASVAGMDELANWTAKTYKFSFHNDSGAAVGAPVKGEAKQSQVWSEECLGRRLEVRILVEEDPDGNWANPGRVLFLCTSQVFALAQYWCHVIHGDFVTS